MAKDTISGYFRRLFEENPQWLNARSNQEVLDRWLKDNPAAKAITEQVRQNLSNIKSILRIRKKLRKKESLPVEVAVVPRKGGRRLEALEALEALEERIDGCMDLARDLDREGLAGVISLLRRARNEVVWRMGVSP
jgi:hypothetical protein